MNKTCLNLLLIILANTIYFSSYGQVDYNRIILPEDSGLDIPFEERLVQLAWRNNPNREILENEEEIAKYELGRARLSWLDGIALIGNYNEIIVGNEAINNNMFFPRNLYGIRAVLPLNFMTETVQKSKINKKILQSSHLATDQLKLSLRKEVLTAYHEFLMYEELLQIQSELFDSEFSSYQIALNDFEDGLISVDDYSAIVRSYNMQRINKVKGENELIAAKLRLEELIGVNLEEVRP